MSNLAAGSLILLLSIAASSFAAEPAVIRFGSTPAQVEALMNSPAAVKKTSEIRTTTSVPMFKSNDKKFASGMFSSSAGYAQYDSYRTDEFCYIISGEATLTAADGTITKLKAGDAVLVPKGWSGRWTTSGYTKFSVTYNAD